MPIKFLPVLNILIHWNSNLLKIRITELKTDSVYWILWSRISTKMLANFLWRIDVIDENNLTMSQKVLVSIVDKHKSYCLVDCSFIKN